MDNEPNPWSFMQRQAQQSFIAAHHVAISPFLYSSQERWKWHMGMMRIKEGEMRMKAERVKRGEGE